jgi:phage terminase large subunit-like protein
VAIDPAVSTGEDADETGIIVAGKDANGHGYVLADQSARYAPTEWARTAIALYRAAFHLPVAADIAATVRLRVRSTAPVKAAMVLADRPGARRPAPSQRILRL